MSIARCRELIADSSDLSDQQVEELRDRLYTMADVVTDAFSDLASIDMTTVDYVRNFDDLLPTDNGL